jgi:hypothetical protein
MWILEHCIWEDIGIWDDTDFWCDSPVGGIVIAADAGSYVLSGTPAILLLQPAVEPPIFGGGGGIVRRPRPHPVEGFGDGILPPLQGEAEGRVGVGGDGAAQLPDLAIAGIGAIGASGKSLARLALKAAASGDRGSAGRAVGHIASIKAEGHAHHDDDEAIAIKVLLDA